MDKSLGNKIASIALTGFSVGGVSGNKPVTFLEPTSPESMDLVFHKQHLKAAMVDPNGEYLQSRKRCFMQDENEKENPNGIDLIPRDNEDPSPGVKRNLNSLEHTA